jgi:hypothetical protein
VLTLDEVKARFDASRHPDVQIGSRSTEDCRSEFLDMFSTHHSVANSFQTQERAVSLQEFTEYHHFISAFIESDKMFKLFMSGVWNMDLVETSPVANDVAQVRPAGVSPQIYGRNSREQWKYDMHRSFFGNLNATPFKQDI